MKDKIKSKTTSLSPPSDKEPVATTKRKKSPSLAADPSTMPASSSATPKRLRLTAPSVRPTDDIAASKPIKSSPKLPPTPVTPQTPSKATITTNTAANTNSNSKLSARKQRTMNDPINVNIYDLRKLGLDWEEISKQTNAKCNLTGTELELTSMACYSRFFRNAPLLARDHGEEYKRESYLHMRGPVVFAVASADVDGDAGASILTDAGGVGGADGDVKALTAAAEGNGDLAQDTQLETLVKTPEEVQVDVEIEGEVLKAVKKARAEFWTNVAVIVNENLEGKVLTAKEVKEVHDSAKDREV